MEVVYSARAEPTGRNKLFLDYSKSKKATDGPKISGSSTKFPTGSTGYAETSGPDLTGMSPDHACVSPRDPTGRLRIPV